MSVIKDRSKPFTPPPAGLHRAVCVDVVDRGWIEDSFSEGKLKPKIYLAYEIEEVMPDSGERFIVCSFYNVPRSLKSQKSSLVQDLIAWRGRPFTEKELEAFELDDVLGAPCQLNIVHNVDGDKTYANIQSIVPAHKDGKLIPSGKYVRVKDREGYKAPKLSAFDEPPEAPGFVAPPGATVDHDGQDIPF